MKKTLTLLTCLVLIVTGIIIGCSEDKETSNPVNSKIVPAEKKDPTGEVPRDRLIYSTLGKAGSLPLNELIQIYKKDVGTAAVDYSTNLKNMWLTVLNDRVYKTGTEEQKLFLINEQFALENNLAHFNVFYNLLATSKKIDNAQKYSIADSYYDKNFKAIGELNWPTATDKKNKEQELIYAKRTFQNLINTQKQ